MWVDLLELRRLAEAGDDRRRARAGRRRPAARARRRVGARRPRRPPRRGRRAARRGAPTGPPLSRRHARRRSRRPAAPLEHDPRSERAARNAHDAPRRGRRPPGRARDLPDPLRPPPARARASPRRRRPASSPSRIRAGEVGRAGEACTGGAAPAAASAGGDGRRVPPAAARAPHRAAPRSRSRSPRGSARRRARRSSAATPPSRACAPHGTPRRPASRRLVEVWGDPGHRQDAPGARARGRGARAAAALVLLGSADEDPLSPFQPFVEALTHVVRVLAVRRARADRRAGQAGDLARLVPGLGERRPAAAERAPATPTSACACSRRSPGVFGALAERRAAAARPRRRPLGRRPDAQAAAPRPALRPAGRERILLLLTCRTGGSPPVQVEREISVERIRLAGLDADEAAALLEATGCLVDAERARGDRRAHGGQPVLPRAVRRRRPRGDPGRRARGDRRSASPGCRRRPRGPRRSPPSPGPSFDVTVLEAVARSDVLAAVDEAVAAGRGRGGPRRLRPLPLPPRAPAGGPLRRAEPRRAARACTSTIARALESRGGREAEVAHHLLAALPSGDALRAVNAAARAARRAGLDARPRGVGDALPPRAGRRARRRPARRRPGRDPHRARRGGAALRRAGQRAPGARGGGGARRARRRRRSSSPARRSPTAASASSSTRPTRSPSACCATRSPCSTATTRCGRACSPASRSSSTTPTARRPRRSAPNAVALARRQREPAALAAALNARHVALWTPAHVEERLAVAAEMEEMALRAGDREQALQAHNWLVVDLLELGEVAARRRRDRRLRARGGRASGCRRTSGTSRCGGRCARRWRGAGTRPRRSRTRRATWAAARRTPTPTSSGSSSDIHLLTRAGPLRRARPRADRAGRRRARDVGVGVRGVAWMLAERGDARAAPGRCSSRSPPTASPACPSDANWNALAEAAEAVVAIGDTPSGPPSSTSGCAVRRASRRSSPAPSRRTGRRATSSACSPRRAGGGRTPTPTSPRRSPRTSAIGAAPRLAIAQEERALVLRARGAERARPTRCCAEALAGYERLGMASRASAGRQRVERPAGSSTARSSVTSALWQTNAIAARTGGGDRPRRLRRPPRRASPPLPGALAAVGGSTPRRSSSPTRTSTTCSAAAAFPALAAHAAPTPPPLPGGTSRRLADDDASSSSSATARRTSTARPLGEPRTTPSPPTATRTTAPRCAPRPRPALPGDDLTEVEIPLISRAGSREAYLATLDRLAPLLDEAAVVVPRHGPPLTRRAPASC